MALQTIASVLSECRLLRNLVELLEHRLTSSIPFFHLSPNFTDGALLYNISWFSMIEFMARCLHQNLNRPMSKTERRHAVVYQELLP
jgi:hypothetical protein